MKSSVLALLCVLAVCHAAPSNRCFVIGVQDWPVGPNFVPVRLSELRNATLAPIFIKQYNSYGIDYVQDNLQAHNCQLTFYGNEQLYPQGGSVDNPIVPYKNGAQYCIWDTPVGPVQLGIWLTGFSYPTMSQALLDRFVAYNGTSYEYWTFLYDTTCSPPPTPAPPTPPPAKVQCCFYFSHTKKFESLFCQQTGNDCPIVPEFVIVNNSTAASCCGCGEGHPRL